MFSSLKLSNLRGRKPGEVDQLVTSGPPHLDLTSPPSKKPPHPIVTTNRRSHKWSIDRALCPGIGDKRQEEKPKMPSRVEIEHKRQENIDDSSFSHNNEWDTQSYEEHSSSVAVVARTMNVSIERDASGSLGITLRGGAHHDPALSRPLIITQIKPGGPADREGTIKVGDRLLSVDGHQLSSVTLSEAQARLRATASPMSMLCIEYDVSMMSGVRAAQGPLLVEIDGPHCHSLGLELVNTPDNSAVVIGHVKTGSIAERCGALLPGDQILAVNDICVEDTKMTAEDVNQLMWTGNSCVLQILPSSSSSYRGFPQPLYSCPSPSQTSKHSRDVHLLDGNSSPTKAQSPLMKRLQTSSSSIQESEVEANSSGVYQRKSLAVSLNCDAQKRFGITLAPDSKSAVVISVIEPRSPAERCGSLQIGDRVVAINGTSPPDLSSPKSVESLAQTLSVTLTIEFAVAQTVMPTSGVFTVKLANNKVAGLGITISGCSQYRGWMVISHIRPGSVAHRCGTLAPGDRLLSVNNHSLAECSLEQAINVLHSTQDIVTLVVQKMSREECREEGYSSVHTVEFCRGGGPLGITIAGSEDPQEPIVISGLTADGLAEQSQALCVGDQLLAIGSHSLSQEPLSTAIQLLQSSTDRVVLCVGRVHSPLSGSAREDQVQGYSSPEIPSVDSAVESWDSLHEQSPPAVQPNLHFYKSESSTVRRKQPLQTCDSPVLTCNTHWPGAGLHSTNSLNTVQSDADDTCSSFRLSESVLNDYTSQMMAQQKIAPPSPPCPLQVNYQHRNNTLPNHRRSSSIGLMRYPDTVQANLISSPRRCRRGFHLLEDEATNFPLSEDLEINHPEITFDTFFKRVTGPNRDLATDHSKNDGHVFQVTLYKDPVYEDFGFSVSDGLYERGVFINRIRRGGPADTCRLLQPYDRILQVNETRTEDLDCCLTVPLVAAAGDKLQLTVRRGHYSSPHHHHTHPPELKDHNTAPLPWMEDDDQDSQPPPPTPPPPPIKTPTITKTL
ncbi:glutamate receptor-interacting protein 2 isoform X2 [Homalodisca vitripennis]|uniref:glutamate receptor-interacting protein 2 isoform X2 n=1 Tax=Homalodisca vitripennis TaxID=197043 RepID=UPI001EE9F2D6|nr:glutamate receptor-interacting protein 2 isoform X2 [Homalodisca vitripennis]